MLLRTDALENGTMAETKPSPSLKEASATRKISKEELAELVKQAEQDEEARVAELVAPAVAEK